MAEHLRAPFVDLDASIERGHLRSIVEIFEQHGEEAFRDVESAELARAIEIDPVVVALGGGTLERSGNLRLVRGAGVLVWLDTPRSTILSRLLQGGDLTRPLVVDRERALELLDQRLPTYGSCDHRLRPHDDETPANVAARIADLIRA